MIFVEILLAVWEFDNDFSVSFFCLFSLAFFLFMVLYVHRNHMAYKDDGDEVEIHVLDVV